MEGNSTQVPVENRQVGKVIVFKVNTQADIEVE
jgi:hypothetical protein